MTDPTEADSALIHAFADRVRAYVAWIDGADGIEPLEFLRECSRLLPRLYAEALDLPSLQPDDRKPAVVASPLKALQRYLAPVDMYWTVFDPYERPDSELVGSIADDLADIYLDLRRPLVDFDAGAVGSAVWAWRFNMQVHAGEHLLQALHAMHWILHTHGWPRADLPNEAGQP